PAVVGHLLDVGVEAVEVAELRREPRQADPALRRARHPLPRPKSTASRRWGPTTAALATAPPPAAAAAMPSRPRPAAPPPRRPPRTGRPGAPLPPTIKKPQKNQTKKNKSPPNLQLTT
ncbi:Os09g0130901, partial [Oryza sativa Japonica Group]